MQPLLIDGKEVKRFVFCRYSRILGRPVPVEIWAFNKDHAFQRLRGIYNFGDWDFITELQGEETLGRLGEIIKLSPFDLN